MYVLVLNYGDVDTISRGLWLVVANVVDTATWCLVVFVHVINNTYIIYKMLNVKC